MKMLQAQQSVSSRGCRAFIGARGGAARQRMQVYSMTDATGRLMKKPELKRPTETSRKLFDEQGPSDAQAATAAAAPAVAAPVAEPQPTTSSKTITVEYQRQRAKEMVKYFERLQLEEQIEKAQVFGWTAKNEIGNGRWVMFGLFVGMLTEYATGVDFIDQVKLMLTYLGIADVE